MLNRVTLIGRLGKDPEIRRFDNGATVARFSLATSEVYKDKNGELQKNTEWHDIVAWRALAEQVEKILKKGKLVYVEGKLTHRKWQDQNGTDRYTTEILANIIRLLESKENSAIGGANDEHSSNKTTMPDHQDDKPAVETPIAVVEDDLPF